MTLLLLVLIISLVSLAFAVYLARQVLAADEGTPQMQEIAAAIKEGAEAFLRRQNGTIVKGPKTPEENLRDNDLEGIDLQVIYPTGGLFHSRVRDRDFAVVLARPEG